MLVVPTTYFIYEITKLEPFSYKLIKEYKTKGEAIDWIKKHGQKGIYYHVQEFYKV